MVGFVNDFGFKFIAYVLSFRQINIKSISEILVEISSHVELSLCLLSIFVDEDLSNINSNKIKNNVICALDDFKINGVGANELLLLEIDLEVEGHVLSNDLVDVRICTSINVTGSNIWTSSQHGLCNTCS